MSNALNLLFQGSPATTNKSTNTSVAELFSVTAVSEDSSATATESTEETSFAKVLDQRSAESLAATESSGKSADLNGEETKGLANASTTSGLDLVSQNTLELEQSGNAALVLDKPDDYLLANLFFNAPPDLENRLAADTLSTLNGTDLPPAGNSLPPSTELSAEVKKLLDNAINKLFGKVSSFTSAHSKHSTSADSLPDAAALFAGIGDSEELAKLEAEAGLPADLTRDSIFDGLAFIPEDGNKVLAAVNKNTNSSVEDVSLDDGGLLSTFEINQGVQSQKESSSLNENALAADRERVVLPGHRSPIGNVREEQLFTSRKRGVQALDSIDRASLDKTAIVESSRPITAAVSTVMTSLLANADTAAINDINLHAPATQVPGSSKLDGLQLASDVPGHKSEARVSVPFNQAGWNENLGRQLTLLISKNFDSAQIQLEPPELGPLQVRFQIQNEQVSLQFVSQHSIVRDAVEQTLARLQEMFSEEGLDLVDVNVSDEQLAEERSDLSDEESAIAEVEENDENLTHRVAIDLDEGKIDYFI